jgi:hypothetical protein
MPRHGRDNDDRKFALQFAIAFPVATTAQLESSSITTPHPSHQGMSPDIREPKICPSVFVPRVNFRPERNGRLEEFPAHHFGR